MFSIQCTGPGGSRNAVASITVSKTAPPSDSHLECVSQTCTRVQGPGDNVCGPEGTACGGSGSNICQGSTRIVEDKDGVVVCLLSSSFNNDRCTTIASGTVRQTLGIYNGSGQTIYSRPALFYSPTQTCGAHDQNSSGTGGIVSGDTSVAPGQSGQVTYTFTVPQNCGSWQLDDTWGPGSGYFVIGKVINTGRNCAATTTVPPTNTPTTSIPPTTTVTTTTAPPTPTPPPVTLQCAPASQTVGVNQNASFVATGGTGSYSWSAQSGSPTSGSGSTFATSYASAGQYTVGVTSGNQTAQCTVVVQQAVTPGPLVCSPASQTVNIGQLAQFVVSGGSGQFSWSAPSGSPTSGQGSSFGTSYGAAGSYVVTVSDLQTEDSENCSVTVPQTQTPPPTTMVGAPALQMTKVVRNVTQGGGEADTVAANPGDSVEFVITVTSTGTSTATQVTVRDTLPSGLTYLAGTTTVDGSTSLPDGIVSGGVNIGDMPPGQTRTIRFRARVAEAGFFPFGTSTLVNTAFAKATNTPEVSDVAFVTVTRAPANPVLTIQKFGRNVSRNEVGERTSVTASPVDTIEFTVRVRNVSQTPATNVMVRDVVPQGITYLSGTATLNGQPTSDALAAGGLNIGTLQPGQEAVIRFQGRVAPANQLPVGTTTLINVALTWADGVPELQAQLPVIITTVSVTIPPVDTGPGEATVLALIISAIVTLLYVGYTSTDAFRRREASGIARTGGGQNFGV